MVCFVIFIYALLVCAEMRRCIVGVVGHGWLQKMEVILCIAPQTRAKTLRTQDW